MDEIELSVIAEKAAVQAVLINYATGIDYKNWDLFASCFTDPVRADYKDLGLWTSRDELVEFMTQAHVGFESSNHMLTNFVIDIDGEQATARCYVHAVLVMANDPKQFWETVATYDDKLVKGPDGWAISERIMNVKRMQFHP